MSAAIAFLAGMGSGYIHSKDKSYERDRQAKRDAREEEIYQAQKAEREQAKADKDALRVAGSDVAVEEETKAFQAPADSADMDMPVAAANTVPRAKSYRVGAKDFAGDGVAAQADAAAQNTPDGKRTRTIAALAAQGNVLGADQLKTSGLQGQAAQMSIDKAKRDEANAVFDQGIKTALQTGGPQALAEFMSNSTADGKDGAVKFKAAIAPDGKSWQMTRIGDDGKAVPFGGSFAADEGGMATAGMMLSRSVPDTEKVKHLMSEKEAARKAKHDDGMLGVAKQNANTNEQWRKDQVRLASERVSAASSGGSGKAGEAAAADFDPLAGFDSKKAQAVAFEQASKEATEAAALGKPMTPKEQGIRAQQIFQSTADAMANENRNRYVAGVASKELRAVAADPVAYASTYQKAIQAGLTAPALESLGFKPPAPPKNTPAAVAATGVTPPTAAPARQPAAPAAPAPLNTVDQIQQNHIASMAPLAQQYKQATQQFVAAAQSGDQAAIAKYMQAKEALRAELTKQAQAKFGNGAAAVLQQLTAN